MSRTPIRKRARQRGLSPVSTVLEGAMVMGWFVVLLLGEKAVSNAADARRFSESAAEESATKSSANQCQAQGAQVNKASASPSVTSAGALPVQQAISVVQMLGCGQERTFPNYTNDLKGVKVKAQAQADAVPGDVNPAGKTFEGERALGCTEKPLDKPKGSVDEYRQKLWMQNLKGY